jgi:hypothetical protein
MFLQFVSPPRVKRCNARKGVAVDYVQDNAAWGVADVGDDITGPNGSDALAMVTLGPRRYRRL